MSEHDTAAAAATATHTPSRYDGIIAGTLAFKIADRAVVTDIETIGVRCGVDERKRPLYDTRPMIDAREQPADWVEMATQAIAYAAARGLIQPQPGAPHIVAICRFPV